MLSDRIGSPTGILKVKTETIGDVAIRETYLVRYEVSARSAIVHVLRERRQLDRKRFYVGRYF